MHSKAKSPLSLARHFFVPSTIPRCGLSKTLCEPKLIHLHVDHLGFKVGLHLEGPLSHPFCISVLSHERNCHLGLHGFHGFSTWPNPLSFWASLNFKDNCMLVFLSLTTRVYNTFMALTMAFMDSDQRTTSTWKALTLAHSHSISTWTTSFVAWKISPTSSWSLASWAFFATWAF